ncbi:basic leucine zipper and W2 domain-containing protein 1-A [Eutrema salsugineum]|uniref:basic leucine zipper and W2 domain-containing protein 1-A n=1 Tax=Eutrema salsugineum TaxID=72664 RepID=UPI000CED0022|nr:basic leucine zipper and W2 domain-containing protein 1-A [Eutrema salsugineum]XP_024012418.1 basic leucine zipper and W2 domain-containing protein 1-A [Eutrema salsugineum]
MSSKEKPTLGGTRIKTRKRNIAPPLDPAAFSDAVVVIYLDNAGDLVVFIGGRTQTCSVKSDDGECHPYSIIDCEPTREAILPSVVYIQNILRRKPFLIKNLENVTRRFLQSLELFEESERKNLAIFTAFAFSQKLSGLPAETVFQPLLEDNLVAKGIVLTFVTDFLNEYLVENSLDDLIAILRRGKMEDKLLDFLPPTKRTTESFAEHFTKAGSKRYLQAK